MFGFQIVVELLKIEEYLFCLLLSIIEDQLTSFKILNFIPGFVVDFSSVLASCFLEVSFSSLSLTESVSQILLSIFPLTSKSHRLWVTHSLSKNKTFQLSLSNWISEPGFNALKLNSLFQFVTFFHSAIAIADTDWPSCK